MSSRRLVAVLLCVWAPIALAARFRDVIGRSPLEVSPGEARAIVERAGYNLDIELVDRPGHVGKIIYYDNADVPVGGRFKIQVGAVAVPQFANSSVAAMRSEIERLRKLGIIVATKDVPLPSGRSGVAGIVSRQDPGAGALLGTGGTVTLYVYGSGDLVEVPNLVTQTRAGAQRILSGRGFAVVERPDTVKDRRMVDAVTGTDPAGGSRARRGSTVVVYYGVAAKAKATTPPPSKEVKKPEPKPQATAREPAPSAVVPDVKGLPVARATSRLRDAGFVVMVRSITTDKSHDTVAVHDTRPAAGTRVARGDTVVLYRYGPRKAPKPSSSVVMPSVVGMPQREAEEALGRIGLTASVDTAPTGSARDIGAVIRQWPAAGQPAKSSSKVSLTVGRGRRTNAVAPILIGAGVIAVLIFGGLLIRGRPGPVSEDVMQETDEDVQPLADERDPDGDNEDDAVDLVIDEQQTRQDAARASVTEATEEAFSQVDAMLAALEVGHSPADVLRTYEALERKALAGRGIRHAYDQLRQMIGDLVARPAAIRSYPDCGDDMERASALRYHAARARLEILAGGRSGKAVSSAAESAKPVPRKSTAETGRMRESGGRATEDRQVTRKPAERPTPKPARAAATADDIKHVVSLFNAALEPDGDPRPFRAEFMPRMVRCISHGQEVQVAERAGSNLMMVQCGSDWLLMPSWEVDHYHDTDLRACFEVESRAVEDDDRFLLELVVPAECRSGGKHWTVGKKGRIVLAKKT